MVDIIGIEWSFLNSSNSLNDFGKRPLTEIAHEYGLLVHPFAAKDDFLKFHEESAISEYEYYINQGVDGIFTEFPKTADLAFDYFIRVTP